MSDYNKIAERLVELNRDNGFSLYLEQGECSGGHPILILKHYGNDGKGIVLIHNNEPSAEEILRFLEAPVIEIFLNQGLFDTMDDVFIYSHPKGVSITVYKEISLSDLQNDQAQSVFAQSFAQMDEAEFQIMLDRMDSAERVVARRLRQMGMAPFN